MQERGPAAYIAEFVGTLMLVFIVTMAVSGFVIPASANNPNPFIDFSVLGLVHVFVLFVLIQTLAIVSGAHFNPAVTAVMVALRQIRPSDAAIYVVVQLAGAVAGALLTRLLNTDFEQADLNNFGAPAISARLDGSVPLGMLVEGIGTFILVWAIVGVAVNPHAPKDWAGLVIGGALGLAVMTLGPYTGASLNPARAFGPMLVSGEFGGFDDFLFAYVLAPILGALLAGFAYHRLYIAPGATGDDKPMEPVG